MHNLIEKKRKDRLKEDIEKLRKLIPDANFVVKKQVCNLLLKVIVFSVMQIKNDAKQT